MCVCGGGGKRDRKRKRRAKEWEKELSLYLFSKSHFYSIFIMRVLRGLTAASRSTLLYQCSDFKVRFQCVVAALSAGIMICRFTRPLSDR